MARERGWGDEFETMTNDTIPASLLSAVHARVRRAFDEHHLPGIALGVVRDGRLAWDAGFGYADLDSGRGPDRDTLFRVASISKTVTATAIMQLRDAGALRLDDPLGRHLPEFAAVRVGAGSLEDVTLRRLLSHRAGLMTEGPFAYWETQTFPAVADVLAALPESDLSLAPDTAVKYSNLAFALLGEVVARASSRPFEAYVQDALFAPLDMTSSSFAPDDALRARLAVGYDMHPFEDEPQPAGHTPAEGIAAAAGLYTTLADLARWLAFHGRTGADDALDAVLSRRTVAEMQQPQFLDPTWSDARCLGWSALRRGERIYHGHGGSIHGFITQVLFSVAARAGVVVLTNEGGHSAAQPLAVDLLDAVIDQWPVPADAPAPARPIPTPEAWRPLLGRYRYWRGGLVQVECRAGVLRLAPPPGVAQTLHAPAALTSTADPHAFRVAEGRGAGEVATFESAPNGSITGFELAGFRYRRLFEAPDA